MVSMIVDGTLMHGPFMYPNICIDVRDPVPCTEVCNSQDVLTQFKTIAIQASPYKAADNEVLCY